MRDRDVGEERFIPAAPRYDEDRSMTGDPALRIATWNVNSVRQRLEPLTAYLREVAPDVLCLQEIKCEDKAFPRAEIEDLGYNVETHGQKTFNGVAILSKTPIEVVRGLPKFEHDPQARYIEAVVSHRSRRCARRQHLSAQRQSAGDGKIPL